jgi:tripartite-type tricarboxylate transporter receptor subunit TctC
MLGCTAFVAIGVAGTARAADNFPSKPIHIIVPVSAGGTVDMVARLVGKGLGEKLHQSVIVENRPSASSLIGTRYVAQAAPDGYTLLAVANTFISAPEFVPEANYDAIKDFTPITVTAQIPMVLDVTPSFPAKTLEEYIARAKAKPGEVNYVSSGVGSTGYIGAELFSREAGIKMQNISYKGNSQALTDLVGGQVMSMFDQVSTSIPYVRSGKLRALAVTTKTRSPALPDVPTMAEAGLPGYEDSTFNALLAPANTPQPIVDKLYKAISEVLASPELKAQLLQQGIEAAPSASPAAFGKYLEDMRTKYREIAKDTPKS